MAEDLAQGGKLGRIAGRGRRAVALDEADRGRVDAGIVVGPPQAGDLALAARCHRPFGSPVIRAAGPPDHCVDAVTGGERVRQPLEHHDAGALAEDETVGAPVERPAHAPR